MSAVAYRTRLIRVCVASIALSITLGSLCLSLQSISARARKPPGTMYYAKRMADGKEWTTHNADAITAPSYCYADEELNCHRYGRLYTWESAQRACQSLGDGWRLPTEDEWRQMSKHYGGISEDSDDRGKSCLQGFIGWGQLGIQCLARWWSLR